MRVFLDTNVLLDVALERGEFFQASKECLSWCQKTDQETFIDWHSVSKLFYVIGGLAFIHFPDARQQG